MNKQLQSYLITDPKYYTNNPSTFKSILEHTIHKNKIDFICFRDKESSNYEELARVFVDTCKTLNIKNIFLNSDYLLASKLKASGVHLTSTQFDKIEEAKDLGLEVIISCHNQEDIQKAKEVKVKTITFSPIFSTPNKGKEKGTKVLNEIVTKHKDINIFALGGIIKHEHVKEIASTNVYGFASIRYFL